jgi:RNA polymerase-binding protein DksA
MITEEQIKIAKEKLQVEKANIESQLGKFAKKDPTIEGNYKTEFPDFGDEIDDNAQEVAEYEQNISREHELENELLLIENALNKIENGTYGKCENCGQDIPWERLEIRPQAKLCIGCKEKSE